MLQAIQIKGDLSPDELLASELPPDELLKVRWAMSPEELLHVVYSMIDRCFARGMELGEVLVEIEDYLASIEA
jgi:hypothetical protein